MLSEVEMRQRLRMAMTEYGGQKRIAEKAGVTPSAVSQMVKREGSVSDDVARALGYRKAVVYFPA